MTGISTLGQILTQIERTKDQQSLLDTLSTQLATGRKTQRFTGLGDDILTSQSARASANSLEKYITNIQNADRRIDLMLVAIEEFQKHTESLLNFMVGFSQDSPHQEGEVVRFDDPGTPNIVETTPLGMTSAEPDVDLQNIIEFSEDIFEFYSDLLNQRDGNRFLLAGAETTTQPLGDTATMDAALSSLLTDWKGGTITTTDFIADLQDRTTANGNNDAMTDAIVGYAAGISGGNVKDVSVRTDENTELNYTVLANEQAFRDVLVVTSFLKNENMPPIADQVDPNTFAVITEGAPGADMDEMKDNFYQVFRELTRMVDRAVDEIDQIRFRLENSRARIEEVKIAHQEEQNLLLKTIDDIESVDQNEVAVLINAVAIQLDASFRVTARTQELSLVNFL